jgi:hypothetical protein
MERPTQLVNFGCFLGRLMKFVLQNSHYFMAYQIDIPNDGACLFTCLAIYAWYCEKYSLKKLPILSTDPGENRELLCNFLLINCDSTMIADSVNQLTVHQYFMENYGPKSSDRKAVHLSNQSHDIVLCDTFDDYLTVMRNPVAHADELFVWAASKMFNIRLSLLEQSSPKIDDPDLRNLVEMGYSRTAAEKALQQFAGNLNLAIEFLLQHPPQSSESDVVWREDVYNPDEAFEVRIVRTGRHFQLVLPQYVPRETEPKLPPRTELFAAQMMWHQHKRSQGCSGGAAAVYAPPTQSCRKSFAGGGAAAIPHQPPHSFGHSKLVERPQCWKDKLKQSFQSLDICHLADTIVRPSGQYLSSDDISIQFHLLSSVAFDALRTFEKITAAFVYKAPKITSDDFRTMHNIVASFKIAEQMFRCTAVVFNDGNVVAFPELKKLQKSDPKRNQQRVAFHNAINSHFEKNPEVVIDKMLFEPCV